MFKKNDLCCHGYTRACSRKSLQEWKMPNWRKPPGEATTGVRSAPLPSNADNHHKLVHAPAAFGDSASATRAEPRRVSGISSRNLCKPGQRFRVLTAPVCRSLRGRSGRLRRARRPPAGLWGDPLEAVLQESQTGRLQRSKVRTPPLLSPVPVGPGSVPKVCLRRKVHSAPNQLSAVLQQPEPKDRPQISEPTFMESSATQACVPLMLAPSRPPPQVRQPGTAPLGTAGFYCSLTFIYLFNSQPPKKFSGSPPTSTTEAVSCPF